MKFDLFEPESLREAVDYLQQEQDCCIMAGGTDLLVKLKQGLLRAPRIVSLHKVGGLDGINYIPGKGLHIGPLVTHSQIAAHPIVIEKYTALAQASLSVGSPQIRNRGTIVGNLANASPAADTAPALLALAAEVVVEGRGQARQIALADFFRGPGQTCLNKQEIITGLFLPEPAVGTKSVYYKIGRRKALEIAICGVALAAQPMADIWLNPKLALGAVAPVPVLALKAGAVLAGQIWTEEIRRKAAQAAQGECHPIDDQRASAQYRRDMVEVAVTRVINQLESSKVEGTGV